LNSIYSDIFDSNDNLHIIGIGQSGDTDIAPMIEDQILPWVIDNSSDNIWNNWDITNRDLVFLDKNGDYVLKINLSSSDEQDKIINVINCLLNND